MNIRQKIKEKSLALAKGVSVTDVRIGLGYTAVLLDNGSAGVAYTFHRELTGGCNVFKGLRPLAGRQASELLGLFDSTDMIESAVALAASNALSNTPKEWALEGDALEHLKLHPDDRVGMVGYFAPLIPLLKKRTASLKIFEQVEYKNENLLPEQDAIRELPHCQVALVTSTSILNHTIDAILDATRSCRDVVMLGASTPLIPDVFTDTPVTMLSGVVVTRPGEIIRIVSEGGGMRFFKNNIRKVNIRLKS